MISKDSIKSKTGRQSPKVPKIENCPAGEKVVQDKNLPKTIILSRNKFAEDKNLKWKLFGDKEY